MMKFILVSLCLVGLASATMLPQIYPNPWHPKTYKLQMNDPPLKAWAPIIKDYDKELQIVYRVWQYLNFMDEEELRKIGEMGKQWKQYPDLVETVEAISQLANIPFDPLFFLQFTYEFSTMHLLHACSSIIVRNAREEVIHGRNMDFPGWNIFGALTATVEYYRGNEHVFTCTQYVGAAFCLTGIKPGKFAVTIDTRHDPETHWEDTLKALKQEGAPMSSWLTLMALRDANSWEEALHMLSTTTTASPVYYILSGVKPNEGAIIEKQIHGYHQIHLLNETNWYLVQTNYDHDKPEPVYDQRRPPVEKFLNRHGNSSFTTVTMFQNILDKWPTLNIASVISIVLVPSTGYQDLTTWHGGYERNRTRPANPNDEMTPEEVDQFARELADQLVEQDAIVRASEGNLSLPDMRRMIREFIEYPMGKWAESPEEKNKEKEFLGRL